VSFYHEEKNKAYYFVSNLFDLPAEQIAMLYKKRWETCHQAGRQAELLFKK
jgi:hypothetical protein